MKGANWSMTAMGMAVLMAAQVLGQGASPMIEAPKQASAAASQPQVQAITPDEREIVVSLADRKLALLEDGRVVKIYSVAVGKPSTPSPVGTFTIEHRVVNPTYYHHGVVIPPGPENPVGNRWMSLSIPGYGIHGTNVPSSIGKAASHGCIRLDRADIEDLFSRVRIGDTVELIAGHDAETAEIFGDGLKTPTAKTDVLTAKAEPPAAKTAPDAAPKQAEMLNAMAKTGPATGADKGAVGTL